MDPVLVPLKEEWKEKADQYAQEAGYPSMRTGKLAEYAVIWYLRSKHVPLKEDHTPPTRADYFDLNLGSTLVDVKSCLAPAQELRVTRKWFDKGRRFAFYIGVQMTKNRKQARIFGFCSREAVARATVKQRGKREVYIVPFSMLEPIEKLVSAFTNQR